jgi:hypothetical protein
MEFDLADQLRPASYTGFDWNRTTAAAEAHSAISITARDD